MPIPFSGCWIWLGATSTRPGGAYSYGNLWVEGKSWRAHRFAYQLYKKPLKKGRVLLHTCDNPLCVNPDHLVEGTQKDNIHDCIAKGRCMLKGVLAR